jgi:hypothetical protein
MSESRFVVDISFLALLIRSNSANIKDSDKHHWRNLATEISQVFTLVKTRNFRECAVDPRYLIYCENTEDLKIDMSTAHHSNQDEEDLPPSDLNSENTYSKNLFGSSDAF